MWGCELLSLSRIREEWNAWKGLLDRGTFEDFRSDSDGRVVKDWWHARWVPLTHDGAGNHYCLDLNPGPEGRAGQIIQMWHDDSERPVVAPSYRAWLAAFADALEAGEDVYSAHYVGLVPPEDAECLPDPEQAAATGGTAPSRWDKGTPATWRGRPFGRGGAARLFSCYSGSPLSPSSGDSR